MVSETVLLWLGTIALLVNYVGLAKADNDPSKLISYAVAFLFWVAYVINALNYEVHSAAGVTPNSSQSLALIGIVATAITLILLLSVAFDSVREAFEQA